MTKVNALCSRDAIKRCQNAGCQLAVFLSNLRTSKIVAWFADGNFWAVWCTCEPSYCLIDNHRSTFNAVKLLGVFTKM